MTTTPFGLASERSSLLLDQLNASAWNTLKDKTAQVRNRQGALVYLGNIHDAMPRGLLFDKFLTPNEVVAWHVIRIQATTGMMPDYNDLMGVLKCSKPTVSRILMMLRLTRWLSANIVRCERGRVRGSVYALHDEPISFADAFALDNRYMSLVNESKCSTSVLLRSVAEQLEREITQLVREEPERLVRPTTTDEQACRRLDFHSQLNGLFSGARETGSRNSEAYLNTYDPSSETRSGELRVTMGSELAGTELKFLTQSELQNSTGLSFLTQSEPSLSKEFELSDKTLPCTEFKILTQCRSRDPVGSLSSSSDLDPRDLRKTTTTPRSQDPRDPSKSNDTQHPGAVPSDWPVNLIWPAELNLNDNTRRLLWIELADLKSSLQQDILDEAAGIVRARRARPNAIQSPLSYTIAMASKAKLGQFTFTAHGEQIRNTRLREFEVKDSDNRESPATQPAWKAHRFSDPRAYQAFETFMASQTPDVSSTHEEHLDAWLNDHPEALHPAQHGFAFPAAVGLCHNDWRTAGKPGSFREFIKSWLRQNSGFSA